MPQPISSLQGRGILIVGLCFFIGFAQAQLQPGFNKDEYTALMKVSAQFGDSAYSSQLPPPTGYRFVFRSPVVGLDNRWDLWQAPNGAAVISIRGTTAKQISWLENFYAAMVPAKGEMKLSATNSFSYQLAESDRAAVHVGWLTGLGFMMPGIRQAIDSCYRSGTKNLYIIGHSQGGAIAYLLTAFLLQQQKHGLLPGELRVKTYCSAAPKPGNQYFAYEYEALTQAGWAFNVVNAADWVPQTPFSVQTVDDFVALNPFSNAKPVIKKFSWPKRWALRYVYGRLTKPSRKARDNYRKYHGGFVEKEIRKALPGFQPPAYAETNDYVRTGSIITLLPGTDYYQRFPQDPAKIFVNHLHSPYLYLTNQLNMPSSAAGTAAIEGTWELTVLRGDFVSVLFSEKKPTLRFDLAAKRFAGNAGCNSFNGPLQIDGDQILFPENMAMTRMACAGNGETAFLKALKSVNGFRIEAGKLRLLNGSEVLMTFEKK